MSRLIAGIDEAGRGAVLGPLVVAGVAFAEDAEIFNILSAAGIRDSKLLTSDRRREAARLVGRLAQSKAIFKIIPRVLDESSLNDLEINYAARIINKLEPHTIFLDVPASGRGIGRYCDAVQGLCVNKVQIVGGNKFDTNNIIVAAASILAKEARERDVRSLHKKYGDFGSGYPSDPRTREWLKSWRKKNKDWPGIVRTKWLTIKSMTS